MAYAPPTITAAGLTIPSYNDILTALLQGFSGIYGANVYLQPDGADFQFLSLIALKLWDVDNALALCINARSPVTAIGTDLDAIVKLNGLVRRSATNSTVILSLAGSVGAVVTNGVVQDVNGYLWSLPSPLTFTASTISATATCQTIGAVSAQIGTVTLIQTPTAGWTSASNPAAAIPGQPIEPDSSLRARQALSVAGPSSTRLAGTYSDVAAVEGVTRLNVLENPSGVTDALGNPAHSFTVVVEGGDENAIALAIYNNKGIGPTVNGTNPGDVYGGLITVPITDPNNGNLTQTISFFRPAYSQSVTSVFVLPLSGYTTVTTAAIQAAVTSYLNGLAIGQAILYSEVYWAIVNSQVMPGNPVFSLKGMYTGAADGALANVTIAAGGTGYNLYDAPTVTGGDGLGSVLVTAVGAGGVVTAIDPQYLGPGTGYATGTGIATTEGAGTGLTINIVSVGPNVAANADQSLYFYEVAQAGPVNVVVLTIQGTV